MLHHYLPACHYSYHCPELLHYLVVLLCCLSAAAPALQQQQSLSQPYLSCYVLQHSHSPRPEHSLLPYPPCLLQQSCKHTQRPVDCCHCCYSCLYCSLFLAATVPYYYSQQLLLLKRKEEERLMIVLRVEEAFQMQTPHPLPATAAATSAAAVLCCTLSHCRWACCCYYC